LQKFAVKSDVGKIVLCCVNPVTGSTNIKKASSLPFMIEVFIEIVAKGRYKF
jgi:hypothetical protein